jgi:hypothetical protein
MVKDRDAANSEVTKQNLANWMVGHEINFITSTPQVNMGEFG